jgi:hypothetical protein
MCKCIKSFRPPKAEPASMERSAMTRSNEYCTQFALVCLYFASIAKPRLKNLKVAQKVLDRYGELNFYRVTVENKQIGIGENNNKLTN